MARPYVLGTFGIIVLFELSFFPAFSDASNSNCESGPKVNLHHITSWCHRNPGSLLDLDVMVDLFNQASRSASGTISRHNVWNICDSAAQSSNSGSLIGVDITLGLLNGIINSPHGGSLIDLNICLDLFNALSVNIDLDVGGSSSSDNSSSGSGDALINLGLLLNLLGDYDDNDNVDTDSLIRLLLNVDVGSEDILSADVLVGILDQVIGHGKGSKNGLNVGDLINVIVQILGDSSNSSGDYSDNNYGGVCSCRVLGNLLYHGRSCGGLLGDILCFVDGLLGGVLHLVGDILD